MTDVRQDPTKTSFIGASDGSKYHLLKLLAQQGVISLYKGQHCETKETVGVQLVDLSAVEDSVKDIQKLITQLCHCDSPYIPVYHKSFMNESDQHLWVITEHVRGISLTQQLQAGTIAEVYIAIVLREVLRGLKYLHGVPLCHRNLRAGNVVLTHGRLKLTNLGYTTKYVENKASKHQTSTHWLAPEVAAGGPFTDKADIWAVGMLAIELATGELPKGPDNFKTLPSSQTKDEPPRLHGDFSRNFKDFVAACLVKDPAERASARTLLRNNFIRRSKNRSHLNDLLEIRKAWKKGGAEAKSEVLERLGKDTGLETLTPATGTGVAGKLRPMGKPDKRMSLPPEAYAPDGEAAAAAISPGKKRRGGSFLQPSSSPRALNLKKMGAEFSENRRSQTQYAASGRRPYNFAEGGAETHSITPPESPTFTRANNKRRAKTQYSPPESPTHSAEPSPRSNTPPSIQFDSHHATTPHTLQPSNSFNGTIPTISHSPSHSSSSGMSQSADGLLQVSPRSLSASSAFGMLSTGPAFLTVAPPTFHTPKIHDRGAGFFHSATTKVSPSTSPSSSSSSGNSMASQQSPQKDDSADIHDEPHMVKKFVTPVLNRDRGESEEATKAITKIQNSFEQLERADRETLRYVLIHLAEAVHRDGNQPAPELLPPSPLHVLKAVPVDNLLANYLLNRWMSHNKV